MHFPLDEAYASSLKSSMRQILVLGGHACELAVSHEAGNSASVLQL
jgi:hypothetical protein